MDKIKPVKVGLIGSGCISETYLQNMTTLFSALDVVGCSDLIEERSRRRAEQFGIRQMTNEQILNDPEIEIVVNTTYPASHYLINKQALLAGKNVYCEKMMAVELSEADELMALARRKNLRIGMAPDTFLGASLQTARKLVDDGYIGEPLNAVAMVVRGYHLDTPLQPNFAFVFEPGGGIPFDMGGYYLNALVSILGSVKRCGGFVKQREPKKPFTNPRNPRYGQTYDMNTPSMLVGSMEFECGCLGSLTCISDGFGETPRLEIYGTQGTLILADPNNYGLPIYLIRNSTNGPTAPFQIPLTHGYTDSHRGLGVADMAWAIRHDRPHRASGEMGYHVFELVHGIWNSSQSGILYQMQSHCERPAALPAGFVGSPSLWEGALDN